MKHAVRWAPGGRRRTRVSNAGRRDDATWLGAFRGAERDLGHPYLLIKIAVTDIDPLIVAFGRTALASVLLLPVVLYRRALTPVLRRWKWLLLYTVVEISGPWLLLGRAETRLNSSTAGLLIAVVPMIAAIVLTVTGHDRLDRRRVAGLAIGFAGVGALVGLDIHLDDLSAVGALLLVAIGYAIGPIIINRKLADLPPMGVIAGSLILATVIYAPFTVPVWPDAITAPAAWSIVALAVVCTAAAFLIFFALIAEAGPARATVITYVNPAVAITLGVLVLDEPLTIGMAIGFPLVIVGSVLATSRRTIPAAEPTVLPTDVLATNPHPDDARPGDDNGARTAISRPGAE